MHSPSKCLKYCCLLVVCVLVYLVVHVPRNKNSISIRALLPQYFSTTTQDTNDSFVENKVIQKVILSNEYSLYSDDYVPHPYRTIPLDNSVIHFCLIVAKAVYALEVNMFVRSVILHARRSQVFFHFVATEGAEIAIPRIFSNITHAFVDVRYEVIEVKNLTGYLYQKFQNKFYRPVQFSHPWSGVYGTGKIFIYELLPHVNKCIVIDSDTLFGVDPAFLWSEAQSRLQPPVALAATWLPSDGFFNSGVMLQDLERMRKIEFGNFITARGCQFVHENNTIVCEHDQHILNEIMNAYQELFYLLDISWNLDACNDYRKFKFNSFEDKRKRLFLGIVHLCCLPTNLQHVYEDGIRHISGVGLRDYIIYLRELDFNKLGDKEVFRTEHRR